MDMFNRAHINKFPEFSGFWIFHSANKSAWNDTKYINNYINFPTIPF